MSIDFDFLKEGLIILFDNISIDNVMKNINYYGFDQKNITQKKK